ncbi:phosphotransferase family protein [Kitasatospora sp. NPDC101157]|uniref:phosphotransferase family protein n=1 Tax=Kitasatospora sp. NPDC101157 TaxID=3364098 RepID=UPI00381174D3
MRSRTKRHLTPDALDALLRASAGTGCRLEQELTDGWFNSAYRVRLDDGRPAVVKIAPRPGAPVLRYERGILGTEAMVYRRIAALPPGAVPAPELIHADEEFIVLSALEGTPWDKADEHLAPGTAQALRHELGRITARLHSLAPADGRFGYPAAASGLSAADWRTAFTAMVEALLEDADRWHSPLAVPARDIRALVHEGGYALDEVTEARLVHFDLWPGNIFVRPGDAGQARITGLIDHERAFWGDPAAELVSLAFGGGTGPDSPLLAGYAEAGGSLGPESTRRHREALYRLYLGLLLVVECAPRGFGEDHLGFCRRMLSEAVAGLRSLG